MRVCGHQSRKDFLRFVEPSGLVESPYFSLAIAINKYMHLERHHTDGFTLRKTIGFSCYWGNGTALNFRSSAVKDWIIILIGH